MTIIPDKPVTLRTRTDADFSQPFTFWDDEAETVETDLSDWTFSFRVKASPLDTAALLDVAGAIADGKGVTVSGNVVTVFVDKALLLELVPDEQLKLDAVWALHAARNDGLDACWAGGPFPIERGL